MKHAPALLGLLVALAIVGATAALVTVMRPADREPTAGVPVVGEPVVGTVPQVAVQGPKAALQAPGQVGVDEQWARRTSSAAGVPLPAVRAYGRAVLLVQAEQPECALGWTTLAGIGWVESHHGTIDDRTLGEDGRSSEPILGPQLDGRGDVAAIRSTEESSQWHGNQTWDHAVGPLQFITSTWKKWGTDADGDGVADPHDLDDAALAAARYLCADAHALDTAVGWSAAIFSYNHSNDYVLQVHAAAQSYGERVAR